MQIVLGLFLNMCLFYNFLSCILCCMDAFFSRVSYAFLWYFLILIFVLYFKPSRNIIQVDAMVILSYRTAQIIENILKFIQRFQGALPYMLIAASHLYS